MDILCDLTIVLYDRKYDRKIYQADRRRFQLMIMEAISSHDIAIPFLQNDKNNPSPIKPTSMRRPVSPTSVIDSTVPDKPPLLPPETSRHPSREQPMHPTPPKIIRKHLSLDISDLNETTTIYQAKLTPTDLDQQPMIHAFISRSPSQKKEPAQMPTQLGIETNTYFFHRGRPPELLPLGIVM